VHAVVGQRRDRQRVARPAVAPAARRSPRRARRSRRAPAPRRRPAAGAPSCSGCRWPRRSGQVRRPSRSARTGRPPRPAASCPGSSAAPHRPRCRAGRSARSRCRPHRRPRRTRASSSGATARRPGAYPASRPPPATERRARAADARRAHRSTIAVTSSPKTARRPSPAVSTFPRNEPYAVTPARTSARVVPQPLEVAQRDRPVVAAGWLRKMSISSCCARSPDSRLKMPLTRLKIAVFAPMPSASESTAITVNSCGARALSLSSRRERVAEVRLCRHQSVSMAGTRSSVSVRPGRPRPATSRSAGSAHRASATRRVGRANVRSRRPLRST
jgi:hypothetical protein